MTRRDRRTAAVVVSVLFLVAYVPRGFCQEADDVAPAPAEEGSVCECTCAKLNTADAFPAAPGEFEVEFSYGFGRATRAWDSSWAGTGRGPTQEHAFGVGLTRGIAEDLDISVSWGYADMYDRDDDALSGGGFTDLGVGAKWQFYHDEDLDLSLAYLPGVTIPIGRHGSAGHLGPSQDYWSFDQKVAMTKFWGRWTSNADLGYSLPFGEDTDGARGTLQADAAVGYQVCSWLQPEVELNYAHDFVSGGADADGLAVTAGLIMSLSDNWRLKMGVQQGVAGRNSDRGTAGIVALSHCW